MLQIPKTLTRSTLLTSALVFPIDVLQVKAFVALADVATEGVDAFSEQGTHRSPRCTFIHICRGEKKNYTEEAFFKHQKSFRYFHQNIHKHDEAWP